MPIITISRGSYYHGKAVAEKLAARLGYSCLSRDEVIDNLGEFQLPEIKMVRNLNDTFSVLDRFPHGKKRFTSAVKAAILQRFLHGQIIYHGLVGHHFVGNISHVLKVRVIADTALRVAEDMARENTTDVQARYTLKKDDEERRKWGMFLYGIDITDPEHYDLTVKIGAMGEDEAVDLIAAAAALPAFQETEQSRKTLADSALAAQISAALFDFPLAAVSVREARASITLKAPEGQQGIISERITTMLHMVPGLAEYVIHFAPYH